MLVIFENICSESAKQEYFERNFAWHAITSNAGRFTCECERTTLILVHPAPDLAIRDRLRLMVRRKNRHISGHFPNQISCFVCLCVENDVQFEKEAGNNVSILFRSGHAHLPCREVILCI